MASRSAAAEARRRKILERGADRLNRITVGSSAGIVLHERCPIAWRMHVCVALLIGIAWSAGLAGVDEQQRGLSESFTASSASTSAAKEHTETPKTLQEPVVPLKGVDQDPTSSIVSVRSGAAETTTVRPKEHEQLLGGAGSYVQEGRQKPAQHALPGASHKWAQYESSSALPGQQSPDAKPLTTLQASSLPITHPVTSGHIYCLSSCRTASS